MSTAHRPHLLLDARTGWRAAALDRVAPAESGGGLRLRTRLGVARPVADPEGTLGGRVDPAGLAVDRLGRLYLLDRDRAAVLRYDPCRCAFAPLSCVGPEGGE